MIKADTATKPAVIAISSHVARGTVGNRAVVFALETLGHPVWSVPTVTLPWHPGHGHSTRIVPDRLAFDDFVSDLVRAPWLGEVGAVLTGYLGDPSQAAAIERLVEATRAANPSALYVCDPVIGDLGGLYVPEETAMEIRDRLLPLADIATPNRFELQWLVGLDQQNVCEAARRLGPPVVLVTSAATGECTGNMLVTPDKCLSASHEIIANPPNGLGDLTAALFLAHRLSGRGYEDALSRTTGSVFELLKSSIARGADELTLETDADFLRNPALNIPAKGCGTCQFR